MSSVQYSRLMAHNPPNARFRGRKFIYLLAVVLLLLNGAGSLVAQSTSNLRQHWALITNDTLQLDTLSVVPGSLHVYANGLPLGPMSYELDPYKAQLTWKIKPDADSIFVRYRAMPLLFSQVYQHKDPGRLTTASGDNVDPFKYVPPRQQDDLMGLQSLERSGSISRGVLFGNNQDLSVNSTLNLELSGRITDRISVLASITDNNIPIQAGGNTLELQDFDQVFIKLFEETGPDAGWSLIAGDFVLRRPKSHFLTYLKKTKGLSYDQKFRVGEKVTSSAGASVAISKGKFARNIIQGIEGVQGPYRLRGNDGETFIVVLSGTERIYFNGEPLVRGQENDYVIDYNTAEVTFTARRLITKDRRLTIEFQYSDKNYARSLVRVESVTDFEKGSLRANLYTEQDHRNQSLQQTLSDEEKEVLRLAGDDPLAATVSGVDSSGFATDQILYQRKDSLGYDPVYVYSTDPVNAFYRITFTQVNSGNGDYVQQEFTPNGRVFRWVPPDTVAGNIIHRGDHIPLRILISPRSQQLFTLGYDHRFSKLTKGSVELAYSNLDKNTFSDLDQADNSGYGFMANGEHTIPLGKKDSTLQLILGLDVETISKNFRFVERYRAVEFERNWNATGLALDNDQVIAGSTIGLRGKKFGQVGYGLNTFQVTDRYKGWKQDLNSNLHVGRTDLIGSASWLKTTQPRETDFLRHKGSIRHRFKKLTIGYNDEQERNLFNTVGMDSLIAGSYQFHEWEAFIQSPDSARNKWRFAGGQRTDQAVQQGSLVRSTLATSYSAQLDLARDPRNRLGTSFTYRKLEISDSTLTAQKPENTYLARIDYDATLFKGFAVLDMFYELGSGLEQRREYIYLQVPAGQGLYIWNDYNGDGVKDLNEFELAPFGYEADHLRVFVPSNTYIRTFSNQFSTSLDLRPAARWADAKGAKKFIAKFSDLASLRVDRKTGIDDILSALNPIGTAASDTSLRSYVASNRNTFYYDRTSRHWSIDHTYQNDRSRSLLLNGFESRSREFNTIRIRWNTTRQWTSDVEGELGRVGNSSDLLTGRNFSIDQQGLKPRVTWQPSTTFRTILSFKYTEKKNQQELGAEKATLNDLGLEMRYNTAGKGSIQANANLVDITYNGQANTSLANEMLSGLKPGTNVTWSLSIQRNLSNNLQVDITYNGRRSEGIPVVHVGGAQVRAFF